MQTVIFRNQEQLRTSEVVEKFKECVNNLEEAPQDEIDLLVEAYAKNPVDKFVVHEKLTDVAAQGDILFWAKGTAAYKANRPLVEGLEDTNRLVLQEGDSLTGDHRIVPIQGSKYTIKKGTFKPAILQHKSHWNETPSWNCTLLSIDKPFLVFHREHGNMALPAGEYMVCTALDPSSSSFTRMMD